MLPLAVLLLYERGRPSEGFGKGVAVRKAAGEGDGGSAQPQLRCLSQSAPMACSARSYRNTQCFCFMQAKTLEAFMMLRDVRQVLLSFACMKQVVEVDATRARSAAGILLFIQVVQ